MPGVTNSINAISGSRGIVNSATSFANTVSTLIASKGDMIIGRDSIGTASYLTSVGLNNFVFTSNPVKPTGIGWEASGVGKWVSRGMGGAYSASGNGSWMHVTYSGGLVTTSTLTANRLVCLPFFADRAWSLNRMHMVCGTLSAATGVRLGIYDASGTGGFPGSLVLDAGLIDTSTTGTKSITISQYVFGHYWLVYISNGTPTMYGGTNNNSEFAQALGRPDLITTTSNLYVYKDGVSSYYSALPSSLSSDTFTIGAVGTLAFVCVGTS